MFTETDKAQFVMAFQGLTKLFVSLRAKEFNEMDSYGTLEKVPIIFWESISLVRGNVLLSKTPRGKVIFPGSMMMGVITSGVLYFLNLQHIRGKNGKMYCTTVGSDWHTKEYWKEILDNKKISAIKICRASTGLGLKEAKDIVDKECEYLDFSMNNPGWGVPAPIVGKIFPVNNPYSGVASQVASDQQKKIEGLEQEVRRWQIEVDHVRSQMRVVDQDNLKRSRKIDELEEELAATITKLVDYVKKNPPSQAMSKTKYNVWDIIKANANDPKDEIKAKIKDALKLYHPNKVFYCGKILQDIANEITLVLLNLKESLK